MKEKLSYFTTRDIALAAGLLALGIPFERKPARVKSEGGTSYTFYFAEGSEKYVTTEMVAAWMDETWEDRNPDHPFAYIKCAFGNREKLLDNIKQFKRFLLVQSNGKTVLIPEDASDEEAKELMRI